MGHTLSPQCEHVLLLLAVTHFASALVPPVGDFVLQLIGEDVPYAELASISEDSGQRVCHLQCGAGLIFIPYQLKVQTANLRWRKRMIEIIDRSYQSL